MSCLQYYSISCIVDLCNTCQQFALGSAMDIQEKDELTLQEIDTHCQRCGSKLDESDKYNWNEDGEGTCEDCRLHWESLQT